MTATIPPNQLASQYDPFSTEARWQAYWEENAVFKADPNHPGEPYCVVIPPPNVTGSLHMGHAFEEAIIDTLVRYHRMKGRNTLWLPGTDHASIAVSALLDVQFKKEGTNRFELGRDQYLERAWQWKEASGGTITNQLRKLGVSVDWSRERFTMDEGMSKAVLETFTRLYDEGLIYRGEYLVNWCPASQSAVSDLEVDQQEVKGHLWYLRYPLSDDSGFIEVATTRPETMLGDTAVAVNPNDQRYRHLIGKTVTLPIMGRQIPIIADEYTDLELGSGAVKITPAHDPNDFEVGKRHNLPFINILNKDGSLNEKAGPFAGQDRFVARKNVIQRLDAEGFLVKVEDHVHNVPYSERGKVPIEPFLSTQWFVKIRPLADRALQELDEHQSPLFVPERWTKVYRDWLVKLEDWCISRQLWWGHQIPAWYAISETEGKITDSTPFVVARSAAEAREKAWAQFGSDVVLEQDPDVLDTWFSSGIWPCSTLGWPEQTQDFSTYYPTTTLVTGFDIIFFWVARMTMMCSHLTGKMPFQTVYIHGLVRDENNQKMSKSKNNGIDPLILIQKYGTDALRYTLVREVVGAGQDIRLEYNRKTDESASVEASRNFANKLWNASRFVLINLDSQILPSPEESSLELSDRWILSRFNRVAQQTNRFMNTYGLGEAAKSLYEFIWGDFCDWYIELVKPRLNGEDQTSRATAQATLYHVLDGILKLLHPYMPHITEEIWHTLTQAGEDKSLALQAYPEAAEKWINPALESQFDLLIETIRTLRNLRADSDIKPSQKITAILKTESEAERETLEAGQRYIRDLARVESLSIQGGSRSLDEKVANTSTEVPTVDPKPESPQQQLPTKLVSPVLIAISALALTVLLLVGSLSLLDVINAVPLLRSFFELVGAGYTAWFGYRYLLFTANRKELSSRVQTFKERVVGERSTESEDSSVTRQEIVDGLGEDLKQTAAGVAGTVQVLIPLAGVVDLRALKGKLQKDITKLEGSVKALEGRLSNQGYVEKAPPEVVQKSRDELAEMRKQVEILQERLAKLE